MSSWDDVTYWVKKSTDILFVRNPLSTSMGAFAGIILHGFLSVLSPLFQSFDFIKMSKITVFHCIAFGVFSFNFPCYINRNKINPKFDSHLKFISKLKSEGKISDAEAVGYYRRLIYQSLEEVIINENENENENEGKVIK